MALWSAHRLSSMGSHISRGKRGHRQPFFTLCRGSSYTFIPTQPPSIVFPYVTETLHLNKHRFQRKPHIPVRLKSMLGTLQARNPQFYKQAALERLVCRTEVPSTMPNSTFLTTSLSFSSQLHAAFLTSHTVKINEQLSLIILTKDYTEASVQMPYTITLT